MKINKLIVIYKERKRMKTNSLRLSCFYQLLTKKNWRILFKASYRKFNQDQFSDIQTKFLEIY